MTPKTHYEPVPVTEKPEAEGWYCARVRHSPVFKNVFYSRATGWDRFDFIIEWLRPRPDTVLLTQEEVEAVKDISNALQELVYLKSIKGIPEHEAEYEERKPKAWAAAKKAIASTPTSITN